MGKKIAQYFLFVNPNSHTLLYTKISNDIMSFNNEFPRKGSNYIKARNRASE